MKKTFNKFLTAGTEIYYNPVIKKIKGKVIAIRYSLKNNWIESIMFKPDKERLLTINKEEKSFSPFEQDECGIFAGIDFKNKEDILNTVKETEIKVEYDFNEDVYVFNNDIPYKGKIIDIIFVELVDMNNLDLKMEKILYLICLKRRNYSNKISIIYNKEDIYTKEEILKEVERRL